MLGRNNSGKSNILEAINLFFTPSVKRIDEECFYNNQLDKPIEIVLTFEKLTDWERDKFGSYVEGEKLRIGRKIVRKGESWEIITLAFKKSPKIEWLQEEKINAEMIKEWLKKKEDLKVGVLDFFKELGTSKPKVGEWKEKAKEFCEQYEKEIDWEPKILENPKGYPNVLKGALPELIFVPAVRDIADEAKIAQSNPFGQIIYSILEKIPEEQKEKLSNILKTVEKQLNRSDVDSSRLEEIASIEKKLNDYISKIIEIDLELEMSVPTIRDIFSKVKILGDDGFKTSIESKGHGLQRLMIFTILRVYAEFAHEQKAENRAEERSTIFLIEEPEIYLHPQMQRTFMNVFRDISSERDQVLYSTHSSVFIDISHFDEICIMKRVKKEGIYESVATQLKMKTLIDDLKERKGKIATEIGLRELYFNAFDPLINEGFFGEKVVIVEGPSEFYSIPIYADAINFNFDKNNISIVHANGKGPMDRIVRIFDGFEIPTYSIFDGDKNHKKKDVKDKTLELLELHGKPVKKIEDLNTIIEETFTVFEYRYEKILEDEIDNYSDLIEEAVSNLGRIGKPLKHRYIANILRKRVAESGNQDIIPATIIEILKKIQSLSSPPGIIRRKPEMKPTKAILASIRSAAKPKEIMEIQTKELLPVKPIDTKLRKKKSIKKIKVSKKRKKKETGLDDFF